MYFFKQSAVIILVLTIFVPFTHLSAKYSFSPPEQKAAYEKLNDLTAKVKNNSADTQEATTCAQENILNINEDVRHAAQDLLIALIDKGLAITEALKIAQDTITNDKRDIRDTAETLFNALFATGVGLKRASPSANKNIEQLFASFKKNTLKQLNDLKATIINTTATSLPKATADEAIATAQKYILQEDYNIRDAAQDLFAALFDKGQGVAEALKIAQAHILDGNRDSRGTASNLFYYLFKKGLGFTEALKIAQDNTNSTDVTQCFSALYLFQDLVAAGKYYTEAFTAAQKTIENKNPEIRSAALRVFESLVKQSEKLPEKESILTAALKAAQENVLDDDRFVPIAARNIFEALFNIGQGLPDALKIATENIHNTDDNKRSRADDLCRSLITHFKQTTPADQKEALTTLKKLLKSLQTEKYDDVLNGLKVFVGPTVQPKKTGLKPLEDLIDALKALQTKLLALKASLGN